MSLLFLSNADYYNLLFLFDIMTCHDGEDKTDSAFEEIEGVMAHVCITYYI